MSRPVPTRRSVLLGSVAATALLAAGSRSAPSAAEPQPGVDSLTADRLDLTVDWEHADASGADRGRVQR